MKKKLKIVGTVIFCIIMIALLVYLVYLLNGDSDTGSAQNPFNIVGDNETTETTDDNPNIIYQGLPDSFTIDSSVRTLTIKNDLANIDRYYTGVKVLEGETVIYDMEDSLIEPGKSVEIDLYDLLNSGDHEITIIQYGYRLGEQISQVASQTSQKVTVNVIK